MFKGSNRFDKQGVMGNLYKHMKTLSVDIGERHLWSGQSLSISADYIESTLAAYGYPVGHNRYSCYGKDVSEDASRSNQWEKKEVLNYEFKNRCPPDHSWDHELWTVRRGHCLYMN